MVVVRSIFLKLLFLSLLMTGEVGVLKLHAQEVRTVQITNETTEERIGNYMYVFEDQQDQNKILTPEEAFNKPVSDFTRMKEDIPTWGWADVNLWVRLRIKNISSNRRSLFLESDYSYINEMTMYERSDTGISIQPAGLDHPFTKKVVKHQNLVYQLDLEQGEAKEVLFKVRSDGKSLLVPLKVWDKDVFLENDHTIQIVYGIYYGLVIIILVVNLFFFITTRDVTYLWYVGYVLTFSLIQVAYDGTAHQYLWPYSTGFANLSIPFMGWIASICVMMFTQYFLKMRKNFPWWNKVCIGFVMFTIPFVFGLLLPHPYYVYTTMIINVLAVAGFIPIMIVGTMAVVRKISASRYFMVGFLFLLGGLVIFTMANSGLITNDYVVMYGMKIGSAVEAIALSFSLAVRFKDMKEAKEKAQQAQLEKLEEMNRLKDQMNAELEKKVALRTEQLARKNKDITDSINYASRIQGAILPSLGELKEVLVEGFVFFKPKDIVSGDFYWVNKVGEKVIFTAADCTGHGVPGALMSMIGSSLLRQVVNEQGETNPARILDEVRKGVVTALKQSGEDGDSKDGMDMALCTLDRSTMKLQYAGANNPLYIFRNGATEMEQVKATKQPVGYFMGEPEPFGNHELDVAKGDLIYVFSDGFADQFGGPKGKKIGYKKFRQLLAENAELVPEEQKKRLEEFFQNWLETSDDSQIDDVCVVCVKV